MDVMPGYKHTEVGAIPEDWGISTTGDACVKIQDGTHFSPRPGGNEFLYVTSKNIRFGYLDISSASRIDAEQHRSIYRRCDVKKGDLLLTKDGANTGNAALNALDEEFSLLSSVAFLRFDGRRHSSGYFLQQILAPAGQRRMQDAMAGNAITRLTLEKIKKLKFPVPPAKAEQEAIAEVLSDADALIGALDKLIAKKRDLKQAAMQQLLTGKQRLPGFDRECHSRLRAPKRRWAPWYS
jgi:type I restriction enzyme, S subunit